MKFRYFPLLKEFRPVMGFDFQFIDDGLEYKKEWRVTEVIDSRKLE